LPISIGAQCALLVNFDSAAVPAQIPHKQLKKKTKKNQSTKKHKTAHIMQTKKTSCLTSQP